MGARTMAAYVLPYKAPLREMNFILNETLDAPGHYEKLGLGEMGTPEMVDEINSSAAKFAEEVLAPMYSRGDEQGCKLDETSGNWDVTTPEGFKEAFEECAAQGWQGLSVPEDYAGQGLPLSMGLFKTEIFGAANWAWNMYPGLTMGAINTMLLHASEQQKQDYLVPMVEGRWTGTMCLTEPQCGTDLGQVDRVLHLCVLRELVGDEVRKLMREEGKLMREELTTMCLGSMEPRHSVLSGAEHPSTQMLHAVGNGAKAASAEADAASKTA